MDDLENMDFSKDILKERKAVHINEKKNMIKTLGNINSLKKTVMAAKAKFREGKNGHN